MKFLTDEEIKWKGDEHYEGVKDILAKIAKDCGNKDLFSVPWREIFAKRKSSGPCIKTCRLLCPSSSEDFYLNGYKLNAKMAFEHLEDIAVDYRSYTKREDLPLSLFYDIVVCHNFVETYKGRIQELEVIRALKNSKFNILPSTDEDDWKYGADIIAEKNEIIRFIQVKPISFLFGTGKDCIKDRKKIFSQFIPEQIKRNNGKKIPFIWLFYDYRTKEWFFNSKNNNFQFDIEKILDKDSYLCSVTDDYKEVFDDINNRRPTLSI